MTSLGKKKTLKDWGGVLHHLAGSIVCVFGEKIVNGELGECIRVVWKQVYGAGFGVKRFLLSIYIFLIVFIDPAE